MIVVKRHMKDNLRMENFIILDIFSTNGPPKKRNPLISKILNF